MTAAVAHPAKFTDVILDQIAEILSGVTGKVLDPFAGTGRIHQMARPDLETVGVEIEPEWASMHPNTIVGDALDLPFRYGTFDAICTSPTYGNRMADHHDARDGSKRHTYRHYLGRPLHAHNSGQMQWGDAYREFHRVAWAEANRVLRPSGVFILNIKDHIRRGEVEPVMAWHVNALAALGFVLDRSRSRRIETPGQRHGANRSARIDHEFVLTFVWAPF